MNKSRAEQSVDSAMNKMNKIEFGSPIEADELRAALPESIGIHDDGVRYYEFDDSGFSLSMFVITWATSIPASMVANLLYDAIQKRSKKAPTRIIVDQIHVTFDRGELAEIIQKRTEYTEGHSDGDKQ